jgi:GrpB-like predicted nucleotidyltransferase (UPF0157 family)
MPDVVRFSNAPDFFDKADRLFDLVLSELKSALPNAEIHHVGSTAIRGTLTKGDLDILIRVDQADFNESSGVLSTMYQRNTGSDRTSDFSAFYDNTTEPHLGIQLVVTRSTYDSFLLWRDLIRENAEIREDYDDLKRRFEGKSEAEYREAKAQFIERRLGAE